MATNPASDEEIALETNDKIEDFSSTKDEHSDSPFHLLEGRWTFWYTHRPTTFRNSAVNYDSCLKKLGLFENFLFNDKDFILGSFGSIEEFWCYYDHMKFPSELPFYSDIHLFKENLKPMWEEEGNRLGGKWILRLKKGLSTRLWELLILAVIGEQFNVGKEICGIVCSIRPQEDLISVWTKTANNQLVTQRIKETMKKVLSLPQDCKLNFYWPKEFIYLLRSN
jgi:translation initiation factor 4E